MSDLDKLREKAEAATPGQWEAGDTWVYTEPIYPDDRRLSDVLGMMFADDDRAEAEHRRGLRNAEFIAAANPDAVIALLDRLEVAERERDVLGKAAFAAVVASGEDVAGSETWESYFRPMTFPNRVDAVHQNVTSLREERDQSDREALTAENTLSLIRQAVSGHPQCDRYEDGETPACGWKSAYGSVLWALEQNPRPGKENP